MVAAGRVCARREDVAAARLGETPAPAGRALPALASGGGLR